MALGTRRKSSDKLAQFPVNFPSGTVIAFAGASAPEGWALCDGALLNRTTNAALYAAIGDAHGNGDGSTTFHLPDLRGRFLRGVDGAAGRDPNSGTRTSSNAGGNTGDAVGSVQDDIMQGHHHTIRSSAQNGTSAGAPVGFADNAIYGNYNGYVTTPITDGANGTPRTGSETRPKNSNVNYIIKL